MTDIVPAIDLAELRRHVERLHRLAEAYGVGSLKLVSNGLDPQQPRPLPLIEQSFPIGGVDPMAEAAMRLNREPGRNVTVPLAIYDDAGDVVAVFGFALKVAPRPPGWLAQLPLAPTAALVADKTGWAIFLLNAPVPPPAAFDVGAVDRRVCPHRSRSGRWRAAGRAAIAAAASIPHRAASPYRSPSNCRGAPGIGLTNWSLGWSRKADRRA